MQSADSNKKSFFKITIKYAGNFFDRRSFIMESEMRLERIFTCVCGYKEQKFKFEVASIVCANISRLCSRYRKGFSEKRARSFEREYVRTEARR